MEDLRYPIGRYQSDVPVDPRQLERWMDEIAGVPALLQSAVAGLTTDQLAHPYRPGGWTIRQLIYHIGDSHLNSYVRFKWAMTEDVPTIKAYDQNGWASLDDYRASSVEDSLAFLAVFHARWVALMRTLSPADLSRTYIHPDLGEKRLDWTVGMYAWHGRHHLAHITGAIEREGWR